MIKVGETYKTREGIDAHVIWECKKNIEGHVVFYVILTDGDSESKPCLYFDDGKMYNWSSLKFVDKDTDIVLV